MSKMKKFMSKNIGIHRTSLMIVRQNYWVFFLSSCHELKESDSNTCRNKIKDHV